MMGRCRATDKSIAFPPEHSMLQGRSKALKPELRTRAVFDDGMVGREQFDLSNWIDTT